jgi:hypothetical protein
LAVADILAALIGDGDAAAAESASEQPAASSRTGIRFIVLIPIRYSRSLVASRQYWQLARLLAAKSGGTPHSNVSHKAARGR